MPNDTSQPASIRAEVISAYIASGARVLSWAIVSAMLIRIDRGAFAIFAVIRGTLGLLNYTSLGLGPAMIRLLAELKGNATERRNDEATKGAKVSVGGVADPAVLDSGSMLPRTVGGPLILDYARPLPLEPKREPAIDHPLLVAYANGRLLATLAFLLASFIVLILGLNPKAWLQDAYYTREMTGAIAYLGLGFAVRMLSEPHSAVLQTSSQIRRDNKYLAISELSWVGFALAFMHSADPKFPITNVAMAWLASAFILLALRENQVRIIFRQLIPNDVPAYRLYNQPWHKRTSLLTPLLSAGATITLGQLADFLYAPIALLLIHHLLAPDAVASYAPTLQIDAALLLIAGGIASVLLPRTALAHAAGDWRTVRRYYLRGTLISGGLLLAAALLTWAVSPLLLPLWLGKHPQLTETLAILPLVLIHTVIGGTSAVGRSVLLGMGRQRAFTLAALAAGVLNVILCYCLVRFTHLGLTGIVLGTIIAVTLRCAIWMPWYTLRCIRRRT